MGHRVKRKLSGTWVNWALFYQVWLKVRELGKWEQADWTVKVDADAVFITQRLRSYLSQIKGDSPHGLYLENCNNVEYGFFGHLEVISRTGTQVLTKYLEKWHAEDCSQVDTVTSHPYKKPEDYFKCLSEMNR